MLVESHDAISQISGAAVKDCSFSQISIAPVSVKPLSLPMR